jgi:hypothetical protein
MIFAPKLLFKILPVARRRHCMDLFLALRHREYAIRPGGATLPVAWKSYALSQRIIRR